MVHGSLAGALGLRKLLLVQPDVLEDPAGGRMRSSHTRGHVPSMGHAWPCEMIRATPHHSQSNDAVASPSMPPSDVSIFLRSDPLLASATAY